MPDEQQLLDVIAASRQGILAGVSRRGYPHMTNVFYAWDPVERVARISTTADRVKGRILKRDPHCALHVSGPHFWSYAVAEGDAVLTDVATTPGDPACQELLAVHSTFFGDLAQDVFYDQMIEARRLVVLLQAARLYGVVLEQPPGD